jgi:hypothetical protein
LVEKSNCIRVLAAALIASASTTALAQKIAPGIYSMPDSGYSIAVQPQGSDLSVNEAGKDRIYTGQGDGSYLYTSPITGSTFELRFRDPGSITALKRGSGSSPTLLVRQGGPASEEVAAPPAAALETPVRQAAAAPAAPRASPYLAVAERYQALALNDKKDVQTWAFCSAAALKRSIATKEEADAYGREAAERLALISANPDKNPCPDAIPADLWPRSNDANEAALKQINAAQAATAARQREEIEAMKAKAAADQKAYEQAKAEHQAAIEKNRREQEEFARQQAAYKAAIEEHQRQVQERKRRAKGGN